MILNFKFCFHCCVPRDEMNKSRYRLHIFWKNYKSTWFAIYLHMFIFATWHELWGAQVESWIIFFVGLGLAQWAASEFLYFSMF
jgi:hypothetical protein